MLKIYFQPVLFILNLLSTINHNNKNFLYYKYLYYSNEILFQLNPHI